MFIVKYINGLNGHTESVSVKSKSKAIEAVCRAAHRLLHGKLGLSTYQLLSINGEQLPYNLDLICW